MHTHLTNQSKLYGNQFLVNLVNQKGYEKPVKEAYEQHVAEVCGCTFTLYTVLTSILLVGFTFCEIPVLRFPSRM